MKRLPLVLITQMRKALRFLRTGRSLTFRVVGLSTLWVIIALVVVTTLISTLYDDAARRSFRQLLSAQLYSLIGATSLTVDGKLQGQPELGDIKYSVWNSGWYWRVDPVSGKVQGSLSSLSLGNRDIDIPSEKTMPFDGEFLRFYPEKGINGEAVYVAETEVVLDGDGGIARFRIIATTQELEREIRTFRHSLYFYLGLFGIGSIIINAIVILFGLRPLDRVRRSLTAIREGRASGVDADLPAEIAPLAQEMNALIENNQRIIERSRTQVGNLAHSLKTPLSILINEADGLKTVQARIIREQAEIMQMQIQHYLQRARIAAQRGSVVFRTPVEPVLKRLMRVTLRLNPDISITLVDEAKAIIFAGEQEDLEEILGNLLENAAKWGKGHIRLSVKLSDSDRHFFEMRVEDDGPGLAEDQLLHAMRRGTRLDESRPGSGLGLSIVSDTVHEYGGQFFLERSPLGGLHARIVLPRIEG